MHRNGLFSEPSDSSRIKENFTSDREYFHYCHATQLNTNKFSQPQQARHVITFTLEKSHIKHSPEISSASDLTHSQLKPIDSMTN